MSFWILDTDSVSLFQRGNLEIAHRLNNIDANEVAITIVNGILVTRNNRDFCQVPNLVLENWT